MPQPCRYRLEFRATTRLRFTERYDVSSRLIAKKFHLDNFRTSCGNFEQGIHQRGNLSLNPPSERSEGHFVQFEEGPCPWPLALPICFHLDQQHNQQTATSSALLMMDCQKRRRYSPTSNWEKKDLGWKSWHRKQLRRRQGLPTYM